MLDLSGAWVMLGNWLRSRSGWPAIRREQHRSCRSGPFVDDQNILSHKSGKAEPGKIINLFGGPHPFADHFEYRRVERVGELDPAFHSFTQQTFPGINSSPGSEIQMVSPRLMRTGSSTRQPCGEKSRMFNSPAVLAGPASSMSARSGTRSARRGSFSSTIGRPALSELGQPNRDQRPCEVAHRRKLHNGLAFVDAALLPWGDVAVDRPDRLGRAFGRRHRRCPPRAACQRLVRRCNSGRQHANSAG